MSYNLHELYAARTNLKLGVSASTRKMKPLPLDVPNFWEGEMGMMEHVLQKFPEPIRFIDESVVTPSTSDTGTLTGVTQGKSHEPTVFGHQSEQVCSTGPVMKNRTIQTDTVSLFNQSKTQKDDFEFRSLMPSQVENRQDGQINSMPLTKSQGKETQDSNMNCVSYIVISDDEDSVIEIDVHVNEEGHLKNDRRKEKRRCNTKTSAGTENNLNVQSLAENNKHLRNAEHTDIQWDTLRHRGKFLSCKQNIKRFDNSKNADATREASRIRSGSSDVGQSSSNMTHRGIVLSSLHHSDSSHRPSKADNGGHLICEIRENKAKLKILSKRLKLSKRWVESADYNEFTSFHSWIKEADFKINDKLKVTTGSKSKNRFPRTVDDERDQWVTAKKALQDFKNMYETIRKNRLDLFPNL